MAYKSKKKSLGMKIFIWIMLLSMVGSVLGTVIYYIFA
ncbi:unknown [Clostridium sp. CAG:533]|nr:unknown [Clostridium sp. CAG:533]